MEKIKLELIGITYNQIESGVYAVVLQEEGGTRRVPIIIGFPEAQAIECKLQEVITPRPLTHDLMVNMLSAFGLSLQEVNIYKRDDGVFGAELILSDGIETRIIDSRSSDAIALAIRVDAPMYTNAAVLAEAGFDSSDSTDNSSIPLKDRTKTRTPIKKGSPAEINKTLEQLRSDMQKAAEAENYEEAARLKGLIDDMGKNETESTPES